MKHMVFGVFQNHDEAEAALREVEQERECKDRCSIIMHEDWLNREEIAPGESNYRRVIAEEAAIGAVGGAIATSLLALGPIGLVGAGPLFLAMLGAVGGGIYGTLAGVLVGLDIPDHRLQELADHLATGKVLLSVEVDGVLGAEKVEGIFHKYNALERHRHFA